MRCDLGVVVSASHNPFEDNGIKLFGRDGYKLSDDIEAAIEARMDGSFENDLAPAHRLGRATRLDDAAGRYVEYVKNTFPRGLTLEGLKIVVDCANGAAYKVAPQILWELGADVVRIGVEPNGVNINDQCGATHPATLQEAVVMHGAHLGIALDGDADRVIIADEHGHVIDGDQIMGLIAKEWSLNGLLEGKGIVATVMSNIGLENYLAGEGLGLLRTRRRRSLRGRGDAPRRLQRGRRAVRAYRAWPSRHDRRRANGGAAGAGRDPPHRKTGERGLPRVYARAAEIEECALWLW